MARLQFLIVIGIILFSISSACGMIISSCVTPKEYFWHGTILATIIVIGSIVVAYKLLIRKYINIETIDYDALIKER